MSTPTAELKAIGATALAHQVAGRFAEAAQVYATLLSRAPHSWAACYNLALVYQHLQRLPEAAEMYARAVRLNPQLAEGYNNLGNVLKALKNDDAAIEAFRQALSLNPKLSEAGYNLAIMLQVRGQFDASIDVLRQAVADNPSHGNAWDSLYRTLLGLGRQEDAIQAFLEWERAVQPSPELVVAGLALSRPMGDRERESRYLALALAWPFAEFTPGQFAPILGLIQYFDVSREEIFACYRRYDSAVSALNPSPVALLTRRAADARLRIGYVSGDFRQHVMGRLMLNVIASHDRSRFSILLISTCARTQHDAITAAFQQHADGFADISELDDFAAAKSIAEADIDVLVDLSGHTNSARPGIYAHRPARSIVTHLGYHGCLGLSAVDYKLTDHVADLEDAAAYQIETPYALETCVFPLLRGLPVEIDPELATDLNLAGKFVFGAFLNILKLSSRCLGVWRRVLDAVPESILLFSPLDPADEAAIKRITVAAGIDAAQIAVLKAGKGEASLRARYRLVDAVMDTFPYTGGDTTLAALDMGVPVVTLAGQRQSERISASILTHLGVTEMVTASEEMYFVTAVRLVRDVNFMTETRKKIDAAIMIAAADAHTHALEKAIVEIATRKPVAASMQLTARQFFHTLHDAMRRLSKAGDDKERLAIAATFAELRNEQPDYPPLLRAQCELAQSLQDLPLAADCLATLLEKFPDDIDARLQLATFLVDQGAAADALRVLDDASMPPGTNVQALKLRVRAHGHLRRWEVARQYSELAVEYAPADVQALFWHGMVLSHTGEIDAALETLNRTLILAPDHAEAAYHAGVLLTELGNHADAEKVFRRALKIVPTPATHFRLLHCMKSRQQPSDWLAEARRFVSAYPDIEFSRLIESRIARRQGELAREAEILLPLAEQSAALDDDALVCELVGELLSILPYHDVSPRLLQRLHSRYNAAARVIHPQLVALRAPSELASGKLKIGYLVDFSLPLVEDLIVSLAVHANRTRLVMTVYAVSPLNSVPQLRLDSVGVGVVILAGLDEHRSAWKIRADHVDILVDASSFGLYAKPGLRSYRPAPIQIGLPGFGQPAGIGDFDFLISDRTMTLALEADSILPAPLFVETCALPVLPGIPDATQFTRAFLGIGDSTAIFGVLAPVEMISSRCVGLWKILAERLPDAAFLVSPLDSDDVAPIRNILIAAGIDSARILSITTPHSSTFVPALSGIVDVVLDTIPGGDYFSVRTSLILGIPIVTMPGRMPEERVGLTILSHLGMASTLAASGRDYVDTASRLAVDPDERAVQSKRIRASWMDASLPGMPFSMQEFTRCFETAIFGAWERRSQSCLETKT